MISRKSSRNPFFNLFAVREPDWHWGLFYALFSLITCHTLIKENFPNVHTRPYYSLPLFEFFKIPDPLTAVSLLNKTFSLSLSAEEFFNFLRVILICFLLLSAVGLFFQRFFTACALVFFFLFQGWLYGFVRTADDPYVWHSMNIIFFILLIQLTAPSNPRWTAKFWIKYILFRGREGVSNTPPLPFFPVTPRLLVILTMATAYFGSFYCKLDTSGFHWIDGHTLQAYLLEASMEAPLSYAGWLAGQNFYLIWLLNISIWAFQSTAPLGFLFPKTRLLYGIMGVMFHIGVFLFLGIKFRPFSLYYVIFIPELWIFLQRKFQVVFDLFSSISAKKLNTRS